MTDSSSKVVGQKTNAACVCASNFASLALQCISFPLTFLFFFLFLSLYRRRILHSLCGSFYSTHSSLLPSCSLSTSCLPYTLQYIAFILKSEIFFQTNLTSNCLCPCPYLSLSLSLAPVRRCFLLISSWGWRACPSRIFLSGQTASKREEKEKTVLGLEGDRSGQYEEPFKRVNKLKALK